MKTNFFSIIICILMLQNTLISFSQSIPVWTRDMNSLADSALVYPVRTIHDNNNNIFVLSTYNKIPASGFAINKLYLYKYDSNGLLLWNLFFDNNGTGDPRGFDMVVDNSGSCFIAGGFVATVNFKPLLMKVSNSGNVLWIRDSTTSFKTGAYNQVLLWHSKLYLNSDAGMAQFDLNGNELWSNQIFAFKIAVDHIGQVIYSTYSSPPNTIFRCDSNGVLNFSDTSIYAERIAVDNDNSFYLLSYSSQYELVKYDSSGIQQWSYNSFPNFSSFGDLSYNVICDYNNDVIVTGLVDTMFKFSPSGSIKWIKPMNGLDSYSHTTQITFNNMVAICGSKPSGNSYDMEVRLYDLLGNQNWNGMYSGNTNGFEYSVDMTIDNSGIYALENNDNNSTFVKFQNPLSTFDTVNYNLVCVDSVWYEPGNKTLINVRVFNGDVNNMNYPSVQIVSPSNDTVGNPHNFVNFFAQIGNSFTVYTDTITDSTITNFSNYTFLISEGFGDTTAVIHWCGTAVISEIEPEQLSIYPNPAEDYIMINTSVPGTSFQFLMYNSIGEQVLKGEILQNSGNKIDVSHLKSGIYFLILSADSVIKRTKLIKI